MMIMISSISHLRIQNSSPRYISPGRKHYISSGEKASTPLPPSHSLQNPIQFRRRHFSVDGALLVGAAVHVVDVGPLVMGGCVRVPGRGVGVVLVSSLSQQPHHFPGVSHVVVGVWVVVVTSEVVVIGFVVVVLSLHPNQPGVLQVDVEDVVLVLVAVTPVVVASRQPHQPGVLQVEVRVRVRVVVVDVDVVVVSVPLLSYIFHWAQSRHSGVMEHSGTSSYFKMTSEMTARILCVPIPTRHPLSATTS